MAQQVDLVAALARVLGVDVADLPEPTRSSDPDWTDREYDPDRPV